MLPFPFEQQLTCDILHAVEHVDHCCGSKSWHEDSIWRKYQSIIYSLDHYNLRAIAHSGSSLSAWKKNSQERSGARYGKWPDREKPGTDQVPDLYILNERAWNKTECELTYLLQRGSHFLHKTLLVRKLSLKSIRVGNNYLIA